jgi:IclR family acetate operon transcriptional repressor
MVGKSTESVAKAMRLLALFRGAQTPVRIAEASEVTGLARSTTHRLLATLQGLGFVRQDRASRAYFAGAELIDLARSLSRDAELHEIALAEMQSLVKRTGETANLVVLRDGKALMLDGVESQQVLRIGARVGQSSPPHATAAGKALLAEMTDAEIARLFPRERLPRITNNTIATQKRLLRALHEIRGAGFATSNGESNHGVFGVACVIKTPGGVVHGALSLAMPLARVTSDTSAAMAHDVRRTAARIAAHFP